ncbi:hypothetical protein RFI_12934 [Reticulomyxa filosa]|uniref:Protein root UVB sensitive/RUS domain-containing protein n=1 Tax=Reticulomyxa filosa TaxID=46433 RepID=X6NEN9_RETFI|nr:hypothetical protein RFI_12934 [Reticulomyxa filosa]|eukprot:ETO24229.1 hypothetical protein RFI_12934 [Reticulomyxa filosa]
MRLTLYIQTFSFVLVIKVTKNAKINKNNTQSEEEKKCDTYDEVHTNKNINAKSIRVEKLLQKIVKHKSIIQLNSKTKSNKKGKVFNLMSLFVLFNNIFNLFSFLRLDNAPLVWDPVSNHSKKTETFLVLHFTSLEQKLATILRLKRTRLSQCLRPSLSHALTPLTFSRRRTSDSQVSLCQNNNGEKRVYQFDKEGKPSNKTKANPIIIDDTTDLRQMLEQVSFPKFLHFSFPVWENYKKKKKKKQKKKAGYYLPHGFPQSVTKNYLPYTLYTNMGIIIGSVSGVLATQSLLYALGMSVSASIGLGATINWVLKDGMGQLMAMYAASRISQRFDAHVRKWRFRAAIFMELAIFAEVITPLLHSPFFFLLLASSANAGFKHSLTLFFKKIKYVYIYFFFFKKKKKKKAKNLCWLSTSASKAHINKYMCAHENLADVTGKEVSQAIGSSLFGTSLGVMLSLVTGTSTMAILPATLGLSLLHLWCVYSSLQYIYDSLINLTRSENLAFEFLQQLLSSPVDGSGGTTGIDKLRLSTPKQLISNESIIWKDETLWKGTQLIVNCNLKHVVDQHRVIAELTQQVTHPLSDTPQRYFIVANGFSVYLWFHTDATSNDILEGVLASNHLRYLAQGTSLSSFSLKESTAFAKQHAETWTTLLQKYGWDVQNLYVEMDDCRISQVHP